MTTFTVRLAPKPASKKVRVFKMHKDDDTQWTDAKMKRENDFQPWQIKLGSGKAAKRFKAIKEGGVNQNAGYYIFYKTDPNSDTYEACPVDEWYSVSATQRYKTLTAEEAEQKFEQRHKMFNLFSVMRKNNGEDGEEDGLSQNGKDFKISEFDDWDQSGDDELSDKDDDESKKKSKRKKNIKKEEDAPDEGKEESDEGDFEQREVDYMSDSNSDSSDLSGGEKEDEVKGVAETEGMRDLLSTDDEEEVTNSQQKGSKSGDSKNTFRTNNIKDDQDANDSDDSSDSDDYDVDDEKMDSIFASSKKTSITPLSTIKPEPEASTSKQQNVTNQANSSNKRKTVPEASIAPQSQPAKRLCPSETQSSSSSNTFEKIVEDIITKYLSRKPMPLKTLLKDVRSKLKRMDNIPTEPEENLVTTIANIIKRLQPERRKINDVIYLHIRTG